MAYAILNYFFILIIISKSYGNVDDVLFKILGGSYSKIDHHPYLGCLMYKNKPRCGATLIARDFIITAAHCVINTSPCGLTVRLGSSYNSFGGRVYQVLKTMQHPKYNITTKEHDIAVLQLDQMVSSDVARPIAVADHRTRLDPGVMCTIMGWGTVKAGDNSGSPVLKTTKVPLVSKKACQDAYRPINRKITDYMLCAGDMVHGGRDTCQGDSGGPLILGKVVIAVVSFGRGCANPNFPGVYAKIQKYIPFIYKCFGIDISYL